MADVRALLAAADLATPMAVRVAATLRLADLIAEGVDTVPALADRAGANPDALARLLRHLATHGVFTQTPDGRFALNPAAEALLSEHPMQMRTWFDLDGFGGRLDLVFTELLHTVRTGEPAWAAAFGLPFWEHLEADPALAAAFDATMAASMRSAAVHEYDWSGVRKVADVGGGIGAMLTAILTANPQVSGLLIDLPETAARGRAYVGKAGLKERCDFAGQSFFDPLPPGADVYLLSAVLHDWDDARCVEILRRCAEATADRVLIIESHGSDGEDPAAFAENDLRMLAVSGGRERSVDQFRQLAEAAGLRVTAVKATGAGSVLIECR